MGADTDLSRGDIVVATSSGLLIGSNSQIRFKNLVSGNSNSIPRISNYSYSYDNNIIVGSNNSISSYIYNKCCLWIWT